MDILINILGFCVILVGIFITCHLLWYVFIKDQESKQSEFSDLVFNLISGIAFGLINIFANYIYFSDKLKSVDFGWLYKVTYYFISIYIIYYFTQKAIAAHKAKCPQCGDWGVYHLVETNLVNEREKWQMEDFTDETRNIKDEIIYTTNRKQQVLVTYRKYINKCQCSSCGYTDTHESSVSFVN